MRTSVGFGVAVGLSLALTIPALAAIDASLSSAVARPGDLVTLTTHSATPNAYADLARDGPHRVYLVGAADLDKAVARDGFLRCGAPEFRYLGRMTWTDGTGSMSFRVPNVPKGEYYFGFAPTESATQCWRIGAGPLVVRVDETAEQRKAETITWAAPLLVVGALVLIGGLITTIRLRQRMK